MAPGTTSELNASGFKNGMPVGHIVMAVGAVLFIPAALARPNALLVLGCITVGREVALLQKAADPALAIVGPAESAAQRISIMGICNKVAGGAAPIILGLFLKLENADKLKSEVANMTAGDRSSALDHMALEVIPPYIGIIVVLLALAF